MNVVAVPIMCFDMYAGDTFTMRVNVNADITGWTAASSLADDAGTELLVFDTIVEASSVVLTASADDTAMLPPGEANWDVQVTNPLGEITTVAAGKVTIVEQVTA